LTVASRNDVRTDRCLDGDVEHLARNQVAHRFGQVAAAALGLVAVHDARQGIDAVPVDHQVQPHERAALVRSKAYSKEAYPRHGLQAVEEVDHHLGQRQFITQLHLAAEEAHVDLDAPLFLAQTDHRAQVILRHQDVGPDDRFAKLVDLVERRQCAWIVQLDHRTVGQ
jgi:hypothetical protein